MNGPTVARVARKSHRCGWTSHPIKPGDVYLMHTQFPGGDGMYADAAGHPVEMPECAACAERYGRGHLIQERKDRHGGIGPAALIITITQEDK